MFPCKLLSQRAVSDDVTAGSIVLTLLSLSSIQLIQVRRYSFIWINFQTLPSMELRTWNNSLFARLTTHTFPRLAAIHVFYPNIIYFLHNIKKENEALLISPIFSPYVHALHFFSIHLLAASSCSHPRGGTARLLVVQRPPGVAGPSPEMTPSAAHTSISHKKQVKYLLLTQRDPQRRKKKIKCNLLCLLYRKCFVTVNWNVYSKREDISEIILGMAKLTNL